MIDIAPPVSLNIQDKRVSSPKLLTHPWPNGCENFLSFPTLNDMVSCSDEGLLQPFIEALKATQRSIKILDQYLFKEPEQSIALFRYVKHTVPIKILMGSPKGKAYIRDVLKKFNDGRDVGKGKGIPAEAEIRFWRGCHNYIHDRYAVIDDDLWHFGYTVGIHSTKLSSLSHGWPAAKAEQLFDELWEHHDQLGKKR